jgi:multidrug efflux system membrane fusion protein
MRRRLIALTCASVVGTAGVATWWLVPTSPAPAEAAASPAIPVVTAKVGGSDMPLVKVGLGTVAAYNTVNIHSQVTGTIQKIGFVEGQTVQPGDLIAQLDPRPLQAALQQAQANLDRDEANLANAQVNLNRYVPLLKQGFSTQQQVGDQAASVAQLRAAIASGCDREGCEWTGIRRRSGRSEIGRGDGLKQMGPVLKDHVSGDRPQVLEEAVCGAAGGDRLSPG